MLDLTLDLLQLDVFKLGEHELELEPVVKPDIGIPFGSSDLRVFPLLFLDVSLHSFLGFVGVFEVSFLIFILHQLEILLGYLSVWIPFETEVCQVGIIS